MINSKKKCPLCTSKKIEFKFSKNSFDLYKCNSCNAQFINPLPEDKDLSKAYSDPAYHAKERYKTAQQKAVYQKLWEKRLQRIKSHGYQNGFLLDIGCATGNFLKIAERNGWHIKGFEKSVNAAKIAKELLGKDIIEIVDFLSVNSIGNYNSITAWALIEHVLEPLAYFKKMNELLNQNGLLAISTPNTHSISRFIHKKNWRYYIPPHHLFYFNPKSIKKILDFTGFGVIQIKTLFNYRTLFREGSFLCLLYQKNRLFRIAIKIILYPIKIISDCFSLGDTMEIYAKKRKDISGKSLKSQSDKSTF